MSKRKRTKTAKLLRQLKGWAGDARLYRLDPPMSSDGKESEFVIVSAVVAPYSGPETYIFPAHETGEPVDYLEMEGSFKGGLDHEEALRGAGYSVVEDEQ